MFNCNLKYYLPIENNDISKLLQIQFRLKNNSILALKGINGSGKTTTLKLISGLICPTKGCISYNGIEWFNSEKKINLPTQKRNVSLVFQEIILLPFLTIKNNIKFANKNPNEKILNKLITIAKLTNYLNKYPHELSGGQKQKVAIIQALIRSPNILLLDEPFSNIDQYSTAILQNYILELQQEYKFPIIISTHSNNDIYRFANEVYNLF